LIHGFRKSTAEESQRIERRIAMRCQPVRFEPLLMVLFFTGSSFLASLLGRIKIARIIAMMIRISVKPGNIIPFIFNNLLF
jgi:hypothetical protein